MFNNILSGAIQDENKTDNNNNDTVINGGAVSVPFSVSASSDADNDNKDNINDLDGSTGGAADADADAENIKTDDNIKADSGGAASDSLHAAKLPPNFIDIVQSLIIDYCNKFNIDDMSKAAALQWRGACSYIGMWAKNNKFYVDIDKSKKHGGTFYNAKKIADAVPVWAFLCTSYKKTPLVSDFIEFVGVSRSWFYDANGNCELSSARVDIIKKVSDIQAAGLASGIVDGRENPTGKIYFSKAVLGWSENGITRADAMQETEKNVGLPDLAALMLPKMEGNEKSL